MGRGGQREARRSTSQGFGRSLCRASRVAADHPQAEIVLQALRIGDVGLAAIPNEVFAITGLKLKAQSPLATHMNLELADRARRVHSSAGAALSRRVHHLAGSHRGPGAQCRAQIVSTLLDLLEQVSRGAKRRPLDRDFYTAEQKQIMEQARQDDNNRENPAAPRAFRPRRESESKQT